MAKVIQKQPNRTPVKKPLQPPNALPKVFSKNVPSIQSPSANGPIAGSVSPPTSPNFSVPPEWLGAFHGRR